MTTSNQDCYDDIGLEALYLALLVFFMIILTFFLVTILIPECCRNQPKHVKALTLGGMLGVIAGVFATIAVKNTQSCDDNIITAIAGIPLTYACAATGSLSMNYIYDCLSGVECNVKPSMLSAYRSVCSKEKQAQQAAPANQEARTLTLAMV